MAEGSLVQVNGSRTAELKSRQTKPPGAGEQVFLKLVKPQRGIRGFIGNVQSDGAVRTVDADGNEKLISLDDPRYEVMPVRDIAPREPDTAAKR